LQVSRKYRCGHCEPLERGACLRRFVADRLDIVAVEVDYKSPVVVGMIFLPYSWCTVVGSTGYQRGRMEGVDDLAIRGGEGYVHGFRCEPFGDPEIGFTAIPKPTAPLNSINFV
jgi:hypothetical protein